MNLLNGNIQVSYFKGNSSLVSKLSGVLKACECSNNLMIAIYVVDKGHFLYCNSKFQKILGKNYNNFILDGWDFWYSLIEPNELAITKNQLSNSFKPPYHQELLALKYHIIDGNGQSIYLKHEVFLQQLEYHNLAINYFFDISENEKVDHCLEALSNKLNHDCSKQHLALTISPREKEVLQLIADGYSSKEIASKLYISNHTAISHRKNLIEKFQVKNTAHLIKKASALIFL
ncbi:response regulator transcription factor [Mariniflexile gromovii]|uniref:Helix-turn-helix transcriptional regulator n=1 Tax=Mariniflexile gromovii TaxID=362523 RepID=A0ABS4BUY6_9FLAO|nr:helix-turn-helix transcriptional regulator [Mariniflexile gromovii]MBP0904198.1 helix-turn-helix transcriptional regulator [Mariniflexile gromovii]